MWLLLCSLGFASPVGEIPLQGLLTDPTGAPVSGARAVTFRLYPDATNPSGVWSETQTVAFMDGSFAAWLGTTTDLDLDLFRQYPAMTVTVQLAPDSESARIPLGAVPRAAYAENAGYLGGDPAASFLQTGDELPWSAIDAAVQSNHALPTFTGPYLTRTGDQVSVAESALDGRIQAVAIDQPSELHSAFDARYARLDATNLAGNLDTRYARTDFSNLPTTLDTRYARLDASNLSGNLDNRYARTDFSNLPSTLDTRYVMRDGSNTAGTPVAAVAEGTWTGTLHMNSNPAVTTGVANVTLTATGDYVRVGKIVQYSIFFDVTSYNNHVAYKITGLPFTARANGGNAGYPASMGHQRGIRFVYGSSILSNVTLSATVGGNTTTIDLQASDLTAAFSGWYYISNQSGQGKYIHVAGTYPLP
jgi:hypothetical protein